MRLLVKTAVRLALLPILSSIGCGAQPAPFALSEAVLVAEGPAGERRWGRYQFPSLDRLLDGRIALSFHVNEDSARAYGRRPAQPDRGVSANVGETWSLEHSTERTAGLLLPNGDRLIAGRSDVTPTAVPVAELKLPERVGTIIGTYGRLPYTFYRHDDLPDQLRGVPLARLPAGAGEWRNERAQLFDPGFQRYTIQEVFPVVWWGDLNLASDGSIVSLVYPRSIDGDVACHRSTDFGRSWRLQGRIAYEPDVAADPLARSRTQGFTEPGSAFLADGSLLVMLRTTDGLGIGPLYSSRSADLGKTWTNPVVVNAFGVMPRLLRLRNGVLVLSYGRPGAEVRFSLDGRGEVWTDPLRLVPAASPDVQADSCGYTSLLAVSDDSFLIAYSWFKRPGDDDLPRKALLVRRVTVRPTSGAPKTD
ncbi:MAG: glycoside hydrolase [Opitutaceae bacterium]|nr:glycoside hydrolase [Opitutaceae bacterium]